MQHVDSAIDAQAVMTETQFRCLVGAICKRVISRTRLWELRLELGIEQDDFTTAGARALAFYAQQRRKRIPPNIAKQRTIYFIRENDL
jgi:hypothetical protein